MSSALFSPLKSKGFTMSRSIHKELFACFALTCALLASYPAWAQDGRAGMPAPSRAPQECTLTMATVSYPTDGQKDVPIDARLAFMFTDTGCFFLDGALRLNEEGGARVKGEPNRIETRSGGFLLQLKPEQALKPETKYTLTLGDQSISFTTGKDKLQEVDPEYNMHVILATITKNEQSSRSTCSLTVQLEGSAPQPQAFLHVFSTANYSQNRLESRQITPTFSTTPLGQVALIDKTVTINVNQFDDCNEKEACLYVAYEGADGTWHGPKKSCVKPRIETIKAKVEPPKMGCSTVTGPAQLGAWMLLLLMPLVLRKRSQRQTQR